MGETTEKHARLLPSRHAVPSAHLALGGVFSAPDATAANVRSPSHTGDPDPNEIIRTFRRAAPPARIAQPWCAAAGSSADPAPTTGGGPDDYLPMSWDAVRICSPRNFRASVTTMARRGSSAAPTAGERRTLPPCPSQLHRFLNGSLAAM